MKYTLLAIIGVMLLAALILTNVRTYGGPLSVEMGSSPVHGRGMFAREFIPSGTIIEIAPLIPFTRTHVDNESVIRNYDITYKGGKTAIMLGYASIYNHRDDNNAFWYFDDHEDIIYIKSLRDIRAGEEVFVSYGQDYWAAKDNKI